ncbi:class I poly(R)-hydroxyalkanoic acid synthase [Ferrimonas balearica]|uniref:class I poly(R)-hydroxyalkanoic acid synthase n=1 Tax=Ferrimonas balearica TaxID=44012 RepID=UPI001C9A064D|nr:class I poly(R)-hydroxyalkanoic acid synthase [Ferrimonas balearica]MBY5923159.1 class I poly(R)-hydroxyalkanoic acid synthase [Ferrimonas balearica]MBY5997465.1 class I poly(R)-hydroxyalkanoic acid synthase [Ferrimonas balearica]
MSQGSYQRLMESLIRCNEQLFELAAKQAQPTTQALLQMQMQDLSNALQKGVDNPAEMLSQQVDWWQSQLQLFQNAMLKQAGQEVVPLVEPERGDRRFRDSQWQEHPWYDYIKQSYLLTARQMLERVEQIPDLTDSERDRLRFFTRQMVNALAPSNFIASNPELLKLTLESGGSNLLNGLQLLAEDIQRSAGTLNVRMTDEAAFQLGKDLATTPGEVIHQAPLFELIQYRPTTKTVAKRPLLIVPPFVNKYYILDLRAQNSLVKYLVEQGHTVLMISWANPDERHTEVDFEDYVVDGVLAALDAVEAATGEREVNAVGYCIGGTLLACAMAYMAGRRMKQRVKSATFFTTILDFSQPGELGAFINEEIVTAMETQNAEQGLMDGRQLAVTFSLLRENNLYWNYYIDGYLKGQSPMAFDLLHWNCDSTNVAGPTHSTMLRKLYLENRLIEPGQFTVRGSKIDLSKITVPTYFVSTMDDHIALWQGTYLGMQKLGGSPTFVLGESGHIAGIINPPGGKYGHYVGALSEQPQAWLEQAQHQEGSWWPHWVNWLGDREGSEPVPARPIINGLGAAPGEYVQVRLNPTFEESAE